MMAAKPLTDNDYAILAAFRRELRSFFSRSESSARALDITPQQHQALLAIRGQPGPEKLSVGRLAEHLFIKHNSAVELIDRLVEKGLLSREEDPEDRRRMRLELTPHAHELLDRLTAVHVEEIRRLAPLLSAVAEQLGSLSSAGARQTPA